LEHRNGGGNSFTKRYNCHFLLFFEKHNDIKQAIAREKEIKGWSRKKKEILIDSINPRRNFLNEVVVE
jgi:putative endonuclease